MPKFLDGTVVLDFTRVLAGPFCSMTLADLGARVIKAEPPGGDEARGMGPFVNGTSLYFASINRGKESIAINLKRPEGVDLAKRLCRHSDVLLENFRPGTMDKLGLGYDDVSSINPKIVYASLSGFGQVGPYSDRGAYDVIIQAMSGLMGVTGAEDGKPTRVGASVGDLIPALYCVIAVLAALNARERDGRGCHLDIGMMDCVFSVMENALSRYWVTGHDPHPLGNRHPTIAPFSSFSAADGDIVIACGNDALWRKLCSVLEVPDLADDPRFNSNSSRAENVAELTLELEKALCDRTVADCLEMLMTAGIPCAKIQAMSDLLQDPNLKARNMIVEMDQPGVGPMPAPGSPIKSNRFDDEVGRASPEYGADTRSVLTGVLGVDEEEMASLEQVGAIIPTAAGAA